jgi:uncharacterized membrane protein YphA (DoxX/SURF4 family)
MSVTAVSKPRKNISTVAVLILKIILAALFIAAAGAKLAGMPMMVAEFNQVGLGQWFRYVTALIEIAGAVLLLWPGRTVFGALLLTCVCIGAFFAQLLAIHQNVPHTLVFVAIFAAIAWTHRAQLINR